MASPAFSLRPLLQSGPKAVLGTLSYTGPLRCRPPAAKLLDGRHPVPSRLMASTSMSCSSFRLQTQLRQYSSTPPSYSADSTSSLPTQSPTQTRPTADLSSPESQQQPPQQPRTTKTITDSPSATQSSSSPTDQPDIPTTAPSSPPRPTARFSAFMDNLQTRFLAGTQTLNELTGYDAIETIKRSNAALEARLSAAQAELRAARAAYKTSHAARASTQREVTTLLARKDAWTPQDLERFTALYRTDHQLESEAAEAARRLTEAEDEEGRVGAALNSGMLRRYHEEQIWSDRIRRASTWGTWGLMGVNVFMFIVLQFVAEPWRRRRLVRHIAEGEKGVIEEVRRELEEVRRAMGAVGEAVRGGEGGLAAAVGGRVALQGEQEAAAVAEVTGGPVSDASTSQPGLAWAEILVDPKLWGPAMSDLYSERRIALRVRDASLIALEGAAVGAVVMVGAAALFLRR